MHFKLHYISIILFCLILGCTTSPELKRSNNSDPGAKDFKPNIGRVFTEILNNKEVRVTWQDRSEFEDGFIVSKSLKDNTNYTDIATLPPDATSFLDSTGLIDSNTHFRVTAYSGNTDSLLGNNSVTSVDFGTIGNVNITQSNGSTYQVSWSYFGLFADRILIEKYSESTSQWEILDSITTEQNSLTFNDNQSSTYVSIRLSARITNFEGVEQEVFSIQENYLK